MKPCGKEKFDVKEKACLTCSKNVECIFELAKEKNCRFYLTKGKELCGLYTPGECSIDQRKTCFKIREFVNSKIYHGCENFGNPKNNDIKSCLECCKETFYKFEECEATELQLKNLSLEATEAKRIISREINKLLDTNGDCFGEFAFEETCWNDCEYKTRCMSRSRIFPGKECTFFPNLKEINFNNLKSTCLRDFCQNCIFVKECEPLLLGIISSLEKEWEEKKLYRTFFSLAEMRSQLLKEE